MATDKTPQTVRLGMYSFKTPAELDAKAREIAGLLKIYIEENELAVRQGDHYHVRAEGWGYCAAMIGCTPVEEMNVRLESGAYESVVVLQTQDGQIIGRANMICGPDESEWAKAAEYARKSMATTRAMSKVCRITLSWIMRMAGYSPTPAEEMGSSVRPTISDPAAFLVEIKKAKELFNGRAPTMAQLYIADPGLVSWIAEKIHDKPVGEAARLYLKEHPIPDAQGSDVVSEKLTDEQIAERGSWMVDNMSVGGVVTQDTFWSFARASNFERDFVNDIRMQHTEGRVTDWAASLISLLKEWNQYADRNGLEHLIIDLSKLEKKEA